MHLNILIVFCVCVCLQPRQTVLTAAGSIGQASGDLLRQIGESETDERFQVTLQPRPFIINTTRCALFKENSALRNCHSVNQKHCGGNMEGIFLYFSSVFLFLLTAPLTVKLVFLS